MAHRAALPRPLCRRGNRGWHVVSTGLNAGVAALSIRGAADLGEHAGVGAEHFNLPLAGHDGDTDTQVSSLPPPPPGTPSRGQLESSLKVRDQLAKDGFPLEGDPNDLPAEPAGPV